MMASDTHRAIEAIWRIESPRLIAGLARIVRDVGVAEDLAQDALVAALEQWPASVSRATRAPGSWPLPRTGRSIAGAGRSVLGASSRKSVTTWRAKGWRPRRISMPS